MGFIVFSCFWILLLFIMYNMQAWVPFGAAALATVAFCWCMFFCPEYLAVKPQKMDYLDSGNDTEDLNDQEDNLHNADLQNADLQNAERITYAEEDDTYDGFHMQREEEYQGEYDDDHEDALQDEWEKGR